MLQRLSKRKRFARDTGSDRRTHRSSSGFTALRLFAAELFLSTGVNATLHYLRSRTETREPQPSTEPTATHTVSQRLPPGAAWAPLLLGTTACAVHAAHAFKASDRHELASRILSGGVLGLGAVGVADTIAGAIRAEQPFSVAPLLFAYAGLLGLLLDREEDRVTEQAAELARRARLVERLVPRRRPKLERIVVHV